MSMDSKEWQLMQALEKRITIQSDLIVDLEKRLTNIEIKTDLIWRAMLGTAGTILLAVLAALLTLIIR